MPRKAMTGDARVRLSVEHLEALDAIAEMLTAKQPPGSNPIGRSEVIRRAIAEYINRISDPLADAALRSIEATAANHPDVDDDPSFAHVEAACSMFGVLPIQNAPSEPPATAVVGRVPSEGKATGNASQKQRGS